MEVKGNKYGTHRVIEPKGVLTQAALKIDNSFDTVYSNEIVCDVTSLNIDSASFTQIENECGGDADKIARRIEQIVAERGKMQNPVTGSGGMFIGKVAHIGKDLTNTGLKAGDKIASLVSLSLTPLKIEKSSPFTRKSTAWTWLPKQFCLKAEFTRSCPTTCRKIWLSRRWTSQAHPLRRRGLSKRAIRCWCWELRQVRRACVLRGKKARGQKRQRGRRGYLRGGQAKG